MKNIKELEYSLFKVLNEACEVLDLTKNNNAFVKLFEDFDLNIKPLNQEDGGGGDFAQPSTPANSIGMVNVTEGSGDLPTYLNGNKIAYGIKVKNYLESMLDNNLQELKESITTFNSYSKDKFNDILKKLNNTISNLEKINDFNILDGLNPTITKTKLLLGKPILIYGYDIMTSSNLLDQIQSKYNLLKQELSSIWYNKSEKNIIFRFETKLTNCLYLIKTNEFKEEKYGKEQTINDIYGNNLVCLWKNFDTENMKFTDNLYQDNFKQNVLKQIMEAKNFIR